MSHRLDAIETVSNTVAGVVISALVNIFVLPALGVPTTVTTGLTITALYFFVSSLRSYALRRIFRKIGDHHERTTM